MKRIAFVLAACAMGTAGAADTGNYVGGHIGRNDVGQWGGTVSLGPAVRLPAALDLDAGAHVGLFAGRQTENARFEVEYQQGSFDVSGVRVGAVSQAATGSGRYQALTLNAYRTHDFNERFSGFAGVGAGWGKAKLPAVALASGCNCVREASDSGLVVQARLGAEWRPAAQHNVFVQYTWLRLPRPDSSSTPGIQYSRKTVGALGIGYRHLFN